MQIMWTIFRGCGGVLRDSCCADVYSFIAACRRGKQFVGLLFAVAGVWSASGTRFYRVGVQ